MITKNGKRQHLKVIAGKAYSFADRFVLGASAETLPEDAMDLDFSWGSFEVSDSIVDEELRQVVFYGTIPAELSGEIQEIGLVTIDAAVINSVSPVSRTFFFGHEEGWVAAAEEDVSFISETSKMGPENLLWVDIAPDQMIKLEGINLNLSDVNLFKAKFNVDVATTIEINFYSNEIEKASKEFVLEPGENFIKTGFNEFIKSQSFDLHSVKIITVRIVDGSGALDADCIIMSSESNGGLVMRETLPTPIMKHSGSTMEIEMAVMLGV